MRGDAPGVGRPFGQLIRRVEIVVGEVDDVEVHRLLEAVEPLPGGPVDADEDIQLARVAGGRERERRGGCREDDGGEQDEITHGNSEVWAARAATV